MDERDENNQNEDVTRPTWKQLKYLIKRSTI